MLVRGVQCAATIADVARAAGVSPMTVSRVVNGKLVVSAARRERVEAAVAALQYVPNEAAQLLASKRRSA
jgi:LacI family transcriptional regulator